MTNLINEQAVVVCVIVNFIKWKLHFLENHSLCSSRLKLTKSRTGLDLEGRIHMDMATNIVMVSTVIRHGSFSQVQAYLLFSDPCPISKLVPQVNSDSRPTNRPVDGNNMKAQSSTGPLP